MCICYRLSTTFTSTFIFSQPPALSFCRKSVLRTRFSTFEALFARASLLYALILWMIVLSRMEWLLRQPHSISCSKLRKADVCDHPTDGHAFPARDACQRRAHGCGLRSHMSTLPNDCISICFIKVVIGSIFCNSFLLIFALIIHRIFGDLHILFHAAAGHADSPHHLAFFF